MEFQLSCFKSWKMMLWKCCTQYASKFEKLSSGQRTGKGQFSSQFQRKECQRCFWTVVLEKTLESPLDCKEIQPVHSKGDPSWVFFGRNDVKAETPVLWTPHAESWLIGKDSDAGRDWGQEKGMTEDEMAGWHHRLDGESEWTPGVGDGQGGLAWCGSWGCKESNTAEQLNWPELREV